MNEEFPQGELEEEGVEIPFDQLDPETLAQVIKAFALREGTDYGENEISLDKKVEQIRRQLEKGEVKIVFDLATETGSLVPKEKLVKTSPVKTSSVPE